MWSPAALGIYSITVWLAVVPKYLWLCEKMGKMCLRKVWFLIKKQGLSGVTDPGGWLPSGHHYPSVPSHKPHPAAPRAGEQRRSLRVRAGKGRAHQDQGQGHHQPGAGWQRSSFLCSPCRTSVMRIKTQLWWSPRPSQNRDLQHFICPSEVQS